MTKQWEVILPITGYLVMNIETSDDADEDDAIDAALSSELKLDDLECWEAHKQIVKGNVCHAERNYAHAMSVDES